MNIYQCKRILKKKKEANDKKRREEQINAIKCKNSDKIMVIRWFLTNEMDDNELCKFIEKLFGLKGCSFETKYRGLQLAVKGLSLYNFNLGLSLANHINVGGNPLDFGYKFNVRADDANGNFLFPDNTDKKVIRLGAL